MHFKFNKQDGLKDCGACCLHNIIRYYNGYINFEKLKKMTCTSKEGTNVLNIVNTANKLGLKSNAYNCNIELLFKQKLPLIAHIKVSGVYSHFIIIYKIKNNIIYIFDPIRGYIKYNVDTFKKEWSNIIITFNKTNSIIKEKETNYFTNYIKNNNKFLIKIFSLSFFIGILSFINIIFLSNILNKNYSDFNIYIILFFVINIFSYYKNNYVFDYINNIEKNIFNNIYKHIINLPMSFHHSRSSSEILSNIYELYSVKDFINEFLSVSLFEMFIILILLFYLLIKFHYLFYFYIVFISLYFYLYFYYKKRIDIYIQKIQQSHTEVNSELVESLIGIDSIKNIGLERYFCNKYSIRQNKHLNNELKLNKCLNTYLFLKELIKLLCIISSIMILKITKNSGFLVITYILIYQLFGACDKIISLDSSYIRVKNSIRKIENIILIPTEEEKNNALFNKRIEYKNCSFNINNKKIIKDFNLTINKNDYILITGKSGIGKSTLFKMLTKQIHSKSNIYLDNKKITNYSNTYLRNKITYVSQDEYIFTDSIKNNILLGKKISNEDLNKILKTCMIDKMLDDKKIDLNYILEENGHNLSGGERQKILLARTLVRNTDFIILDETMNEIDVESERKIIKNINTEYKKTLILISHRLDNKDLFNKCITVN